MEREGDGERRRWPSGAGLIRGRLRRRSGEPEDEQPSYIEINAAELTGAVKVPGWLRDVGLMAWLLVGVAVFLAGAIWLVSLTDVIVIPVILAAILAAVLSPLVSWLRRRGVPRALGAALILLAVVVVGLGMTILIVGGLTGEAEAIGGHLDQAKKEISDGLSNLGLKPESAHKAAEDGGSGSSDAVSALLHGALGGIAKLSSLAFFCAMVVLSLFFLLKDGPLIRTYVEEHLPVPRSVARISTHRILGSLRGYFLGVTIVAAFNSVVVAIGGLLIGVPLIGTIVLVTFIGGFIPYLGAWTAAAFAVLVALGGGGPDAALAMAVVQLLANGVLQQLVQPFAMGAALGIHPLAVLILTIAGGALFGAIGLILAAPLTAAALRIAADIAHARAEEAEAAGLAGAAPG